MIIKLGMKITVLITHGNQFYGDYRMLCRSAVLSSGALLSRACIESVIMCAVLYSILLAVCSAFRIATSSACKMNAPSLSRIVVETSLWIIPAAALSSFTLPSCRTVLVLV